MKSNSKRILLIAATRPNFVKMAPLYKVLKLQDWCKVDILYVAQHPPGPMTTEIANSLEVNSFDYSIVIDPDLSNMKRIGSIADRVSEHLSKVHYDVVVVPGDVDASAAAAIATVRSGVMLAHLEAGLRSFDKNMPEEINRVLIDSISDIHLAPSKAAWDNLVYGEGRSISNVHLVGNIMIDTLCSVYQSKYQPAVLQKYDLSSFALCTFHRPSNVDSFTSLKRLIELLESVAKNTPVLFPVHPRTKNSLIAHDLFQLVEKNRNIVLCDPIGYVDFLHLIAQSEFVLTDSGGVQEEAAFLKKFCFTFRENTERPQTVECGSNHLISFYDYESTALSVLQQKREIQDIPLWDGLTASRIASCLRNTL
jgi:UDP-N-acetylglucosamine 2-epimerase (non-hydrolysing)